MEMTMQSPFELEDEDLSFGLMTKPREHDLLVRDEGTIFLLVPVTDVGVSWIDEHIPQGAQQWCGAIVVEHRFIGAILTGAAEDGLSIGRATWH
jgi:hypothetical protein